jgi:hypothetical protein
MIDLLLALHGLAQQRGEGLLPELAESLGKMPRLGDGRLTVIVGDAGDQGGEKVEQTCNGRTTSLPASALSDDDKAREG